MSKERLYLSDATEAPVRPQAHRAEDGQNQQEPSRAKEWSDG